jgi:hypothetical protein
MLNEVLQPKLHFLLRLLQLEILGADCVGGLQYLFHSNVQLREIIACLRRRITVRAASA